MSWALETQVAGMMAIQTVIFALICVGIWRLK